MAITSIGESKRIEHLHIIKLTVKRVELWKRIVIIQEESI